MDGREAQPTLAHSRGVMALRLEGPGRSWCEGVCGGGGRELSGKSES